MTPWLDRYIRTTQSAFVPLRHRPFRSLVLANQVADIGRFALIVEVTWLLVEQNQRPVVIALVLTAITAPSFFLSLVGGLLADICDKRLVQLVSQVWIAIAIMLLAGATASGFESPIVLLMLTFAVGVGTAIHDPAWEAAVREYVPSKEVPAAVALTASGFSISRAVGPIVGAFLMVTFNAVVVFVCCAISSLFLVFTLFRSPPLPAHSNFRILSELRSGFYYFWWKPHMRAVIFRTLTVCILGSSALALLPVVVADELGGGPETFGILMGCFGLGTVLGAVVLPSWRQRRKPDAVLTLASVCFAMALVALAGSRLMSATVLVLILAGAGWIGMLSTLTTVMHAVSSDTMHGRSISTYFACAFGGMAFGSALWGGMAEAIGVSATLAIAGGALAVASALKGMYRLPDVWTHDVPEGLTDPALDSRTEESSGFAVGDAER